MHCIFDRLACDDVMFGFRFWQALFEGKRWARRQLLEAVVVLVVCGVVIGIMAVIVRR
ncbi:MAG: hypothetical protein KAI85_07565 [Halopseudomonas aestusnigri]|nr:hypothetical protein [Halopseudomonas aestusnigri]